MKISLATLGLCLAMFLPANAEAVIDDLQVRRVGPNVNVRVTVRNPGDIPQGGPVTIDLFTRASADDEWLPLRSWDDIKMIEPGNRYSRDFFDKNSDLLTDLAQKGRFQVKATVNAPGLRKTVEKTSWFDTTTGNF
jgi:hypothetical protein